MIGYYNYTVILTYLGMLISFTGICYAGKGDISTSLFCLMLSGLCDMFDGRIASTRPRTDEEKHFGIEIDSLSDLICFGVLPAVIAAFIFNRNQISICISAVYLLCALIRLAYFNVDELKRQKETDDSRSIYAGLPVTSIAVILPLTVYLAEMLPEKSDYIVLTVMLITAIAFVSPFKLKKPKLLGKLVLMAVGLTEFILCIIGIG